MASSNNNNNNNLQDSEELINALRSIEVETTNMLEVEHLQKENFRLRNELLERHNIRLREIKSEEFQQMEILKGMKMFFSNQFEITRLRGLMITVNQNLEECMTLLFKISLAFASHNSTESIMLKFNELKGLIHDSNKLMEFHTVIDQTKEHQDKVKIFDFNTFVDGSSSYV